MNKRGAALIFALLVVVLLGVFLGFFFLSTMYENNSVRRYVNSMRVFWTAEAGIAEAIKRLPTTGPFTGSVGNYNYTYNTTYRTIINETNYYDIISIGSLGNFARTLNIVVETGDVSSNNFRYGLESTALIDANGNVSITGDNDCTDCTGGGCTCVDPQCCKKNSVLNFTNLFGNDKDTIKSYATVYTPDNLISPVSGITWVEGALTIAANQNLSGTGILIIKGDADFRGNINFNGIIYVIGELTLKGTVTLSGSVLAESGTDVTDVVGTVNLDRNETAINDALNNTRAILTKRIDSWRETQ